MQTLKVLGEGVTLIEDASFTQLIDLFRQARMIVSVDTGLGHLAAACATPVIGLFGPTDARLTGFTGAAAKNLSADFDCAPCMNRICKYAGAGQGVEPACFSTLPVERVWREIEAIEVRERGSANEAGLVP